MYDINTIVNSFSTLVGWKDTGLSDSDSGLYFQDAHPMLTLRAMKSIMPKDLGDKYPDYVAGTAYALNAVVRSGNNYYISLVDNNTSALDSADWGNYSLFEEYLKSITERGIKKAVTRVANEKIVGLETKNLVDRRALFDGAGRRDARNPHRDAFVGFEITPFKTEGLTLILNKIGLQMFGNTGTITLYLVHSSQPDPIALKEVEITSPSGVMQWFDLNWILPYISADIDAGGSWYIMYDESNLPDYMQSINFGRDWSREPCGTCNKGDLMLYRLMQKYATFKPFYVVMHDSPFGFTEEDLVYTYGNNYGINFQFSIVCDITQTLISEKFQFANLIQLQVAHEALRELALNPDVAVNRVQSNAERDMIMFELEGNGQGIRGLHGELEKAYKALYIDLKGLDPICMGCHNKGVRYRSI